LLNVVIDSASAGAVVWSRVRSIVGGTSKALRAQERRHGISRGRGVVDHWQPPDSGHAVPTAARHDSDVEQRDAGDAIHVGASPGESPWPTEIMENELGTFDVLISNGNCLQTPSAATRHGGWPGSQ